MSGSSRPVATASSPSRLAVRLPCSRSDRYDTEMPAFSANPFWLSLRRSRQSLMVLPILPDMFFILTPALLYDVVSPRAYFWKSVSISLAAGGTARRILCRACGPYRRRWRSPRGLPSSAEAVSLAYGAFSSRYSTAAVFWGRSTGVSVASATTNDSSTPSAERTAHLPGDLNAPEAARAPSTLRNDAGNQAR